MDTGRLKDQEKTYDRLVEENKKIKNPYTVKFLGYTLSIYPDVWCPTIRLSSTLLTECMQIEKGDKVLDVGTGCGIQALVALGKGASRVVGLDINPKAVECAKQNCRKYENVEFIVSNLFENLKERDFDVILFSSPPSRGKPKDMFDRSLRDDTKVVERFLLQLNKFLKLDGGAYLLHQNLGVDVETIAKRAGLKIKIILQKNLGEIAYYVYEIRL